MLRVLRQCRDYYILDGLLGGVIGAWSNQRATSRTNESNEWINQQNLKYQREFNQQVFAREDNAMQRAVNDARGAGLSPLAAVGMSAGAGGTASAPQATLPMQAADMSPLAQISQGTDQFLLSNMQNKFIESENDKNRQVDVLKTLVTLASEEGQNESRINENKRQFDLARGDNAWNRSYEKSRAKFAEKFPEEVFGQNGLYGAINQVLHGLTDNGITGAVRDLKTFLGTLPDTLSAKFDSLGDSIKASFSEGLNDLQARLDEFKRSFTTVGQLEKALKDGDTNNELNNIVAEARKIIDSSFGGTIDPKNVHAVAISLADEMNLDGELRDKFIDYLRRSYAPIKPY